jgi:hypothetical protein
MEPSIYIPIITVVVLGIIVFFISYKRRPSEEHKNEVNKFLNSMLEMCENLIVNILDDIEKSIKEDTEIESLEDFIKEYSDYIEKSIRDAVITAAEDLKDGDSFSKIAYRLLIKKNYLDKFIESLITDENVGKKLAAIWEESMKVRIELASKVDEELEDKYDEKDYYEDEEFDRIDLEESKTLEESIKDLPEEERKKEEEKIANLNPQKDTDEEEDYDENDSSMELVESEEVDYFFDSNGRKRNKATGRYMK